MISLKQKLLDLLQGIEGLEARPSQVAGGTALFYEGKEFAHFHHDTEIDLRLTSKVIKGLGLRHPPRSSHHPIRRSSSQWIEVQYQNDDELLRVVELVKLGLARP